MANIFEKRAQFHQFLDSIPDVTDEVYEGISAQVLAPHLSEQNLYRDAKRGAYQAFQSAASRGGRVVDFFSGTKSAESINAESAVFGQAADIASDGSFTSKAVRGVTQSLATAATSAPGGLPAMVGVASLSTGNEEYSRALRKGASKKKAMRHALTQGVIEGGITSAFSLVGAGGVESAMSKGFSKEVFKQGSTQFAKKFGKVLAEEVAEEELILVTQKYADHLEGFSKEKLPSAEEAAQVLVQTVMSVGAVKTAQAWYARNRERVPELPEEPSRRKLAALGIRAKNAEERSLIVAEIRNMADEEVLVNEEFAQAQETLRIEGPEGSIREPVLDEAAVDADFDVNDQVSDPDLDESDSDRVNREADIRDELERPDGLGFFGAGKGRRKRQEESITPESVNPEFERRYRAAEGIKKTPLKERVAAWFTDVKNMATRAQRHLPNDEQFAVANESFRLLKEVGDSAQDAAIRDIAAIVDPMTDAELDLFTRKLVLENLVETQDQAMRFGATPAQIQSDLSNVDAEIEARPAIKVALENRRAKRESLVNELVSSGLINESALENIDSYFHHQVLAYMQDDAIRSGALGSLGKKSFQKRRVDAKGEDLSEQYDYNTKYIESEFGWMADANIQLMKSKLFNDLMQEYDQTDILNNEITEGQTIEDLAKSRGLVKWRPSSDNPFVRGFSIVGSTHEAAVESMRDKLVKEFGLTEDEAAELDMVVGAKSFFIPEALSQQLNHKSTKDRTPIARLSKTLMKHWKAWTLFNPKRVVGYMARNITGDLDPVMGSNPGIALHTKEATQLVRDFYGGKKALRPELKKANELGILSSSMTAAEISDVTDLEIFDGFDEKSKGLIDTYTRTTKKINEAREAVGRLAAFLYYRKKLAAGNLKVYGASKKGVVDKIQESLGVDEAAAHLARNTLGDYRNLTELGDYMRDHIAPFHSWTEVNLKRWPRIGMNVIKSGDRVSQAASVLSLFGMYGAFHLWNNFGYPVVFGEDDEKGLSRAEKARPHLLLFKSGDGSTAILRNTGALGDFLEWFGVWSTLSSPEQATSGEMVQQAGKDVFNKAIQSMRPDMKATYELSTGTSLYPDATNPQKRPRDEIAANILGLSDEYREAKGRLTGGGYRARRGYWTKYIGGSTNIKFNSYYEIAELRNKFLKRSTGVSYAPNPMVRNMREASIADDQQAFKEAKKEYLKGKSYKQFLEVVKNTDPLARIPKARRSEFVSQYLTDEQRVKLDIARDFGVTMRGALLRHWWMDAAKKATPASKHKEPSKQEDQ